jgi:hypothetical protein
VSLRSAVAGSDTRRMPLISNCVRQWVRPSLRLVAAAAVAAMTVVSGLANLGRAHAAAPESVYWGAYISGAPFDTTLLDVFEARMAKKMSIVHWGQPWQIAKSFQPFQTSSMQRVRERGAIPMLNWGSWDLSEGVTQPDYRLANITDGVFDSYISQWARDAKAWGQPFFLRFDHEMNGWWQFPWAEQINGNQPGDFVKAWRHVHDIFTDVGATNATWVWCPNISSAKTTPLSELYPGDSYVDWTCMDAYNWGTDGGNMWQTFAQLFGGSDFGGYNSHNTYQELLTLAPSKPIMLGEVASSEDGGSKASWISDMLETQLPTAFPMIKAVVWMNWNIDDPSVSWPIESSSGSQSAFAAGIAPPYYTSNQFRTLEPGTIPPPGGGVLAAAPIQ